MTEIRERDVLLGFLRSATLLLEGDSICTSDAGGPIPERPDLLRCDWKYSIEEMGFFRPDSKTDHRVVRITQNHETGSGVWYRLAVLECREQQIVPVFSHEYLYGGGFRATSATTFDVTEGFWLADDGLCCPSHLRRTTYEWNPRSRLYEQKREIYLRGDETSGEVVEKPEGEAHSRP